MTTGASFIDRLEAWGDATALLTQAGGRLAPDLVARYAEFTRDRGIRFFVMYGQTEATARMAYLPPERALDNADCIGIPIPRGSFEFRTEDGRAIRRPRGRRRRRPAASRPPPSLHGCWRICRSCPRARSTW